jgi:putative transposase
MIPYIDEQRGSFGVEPICRTLAIAPSSYYAAKRRPPSARQVADEALAPEIARVHAEHLGVYGVRKTWRAAVRDGMAVGRDRTWRLMRALGLAGATRYRRVRTTVPAPAPDRLWVADLVRHEALSTVR